MKDVALALGICNHCELRNGCALLASKAFSGLFARREVWTEDHVFGVSRLIEQIFRKQDEPSRRRLCNESRSSEGTKRRLKFAAKIFERGLDHPIRDLFRSDFKKKIRHQAAASSEGNCCSHQACATPTANLRTRLMMPTRSVTLMAPRASSRLNRFEHLSA